MANKKYLSLEEAAREANLSVDELKQLREQGEIRGFSDGGTWKFKSDDIEELKRNRQADSNPDVPLLTDEELDSDSSVIGVGEGSSVLGGEEGSSVLGMEEEDLVSEQPTVIRNSALDDDDDDAFLVGMSSDSDVQLIPNELLTDDGSGLASMGDSDSDVRLSDSPPPKTDPGSDSDVKLVGGSDSDVRIVPGSDSDVRIVEDDSDSDVQLVDDKKTEQDMAVMEDDSDSDVALVAPSGSGTSAGANDTDASVFDEDESGISLGEGSSITLTAESGISLEKVDSDIKPKDAPTPPPPEDDSDLNLSTDDSGISLEGFDDSGISLDMSGEDSDDFIGLADDSGIELSPADSGIALESLEDSGISLEDDGGRTAPMVAKSGFSEDDDDTAMEMPTLDDDSEFELSMDGGESDDNVIMFDEDEDVDEHQATVVKKSGDVSGEFDLTGDGDDFDLGDSFDEGDEFDEFDEASGFDDGGFEDDLDVVDDVVGEDDDIDDLDVFDEGADDFDDDFDTGTSSPGFIATPGGAQRGVAAPVEAEWGAGPFVGLLLSTLLMVVCGMMMFDLVRSMWSWNDPSTFNSPLLGIVRDMIK